MLHIPEFGWSGLQFNGGADCALGNSTDQEGHMPKLGDVWQNRIHSIAPEKREEAARLLSESGYSDGNVKTYTRGKPNHENWRDNIARRVKLVDRDGVRALNGISREVVDDVAVDALKTFDRVNGIDKHWDSGVDDPVAARYKSDDGKE